MGSLLGHVLPGLVFFIVGFWHLINHIKLHALHPITYTSLPWFPTSRIKYLELYLILGGSLANISCELFILPHSHQPLDPDGTIPSNHLHNFEHSNISFYFLVHAIFSIILDKIQPPAQYGLAHMILATAFAQELLLFHLHSTDHMGVEGQFHWLLQIVIFVSFFTTLLSIGYPKSFLNSFIRSLSILFQGVWLIVMGIMLWTPEFIPKGCFLNFEVGHEVVRCHNDEALERAKSLANIQFAWYLIGVTIFAMSLYLTLIKMYPQKVEYQSLTKFDELGEEKDDFEAQKGCKLGKVKSFLLEGKPFAHAGMEK